MHDQRVSQVIALVERELGFRATDVERRHGGNNLLLTLTDRDGARRLAKLYQPDDARHRDRLGREFRALALLRGAGFEDVPAPLLRLDELRCGVYSFEEGQAGRAAELTPADAERLAAFLLRLEAFGPPRDEAGLPPAEGSGVPPGARVAGHRAILAAFRERAAASDGLATLRRAATHPGLERVEAAIGALERVLADDPTAGPLPRQRLRFSQGDFGAHNALFRGDRPPCFVDFEYARWDDPGWSVADFVSHDQNVALRPAARDRFLEAYRAGAPADAVARLPLLMRLCRLGWVVEHLAGTRPDRLRIGAETTPGFDPERFVASHLERFERKLAVYLAEWPD